MTEDEELTSPNEDYFNKSFDLFAANKDFTESDIENLRKILYSNAFRRYAGYIVRLSQSYGMNLMGYRFVSDPEAVQEATLMQGRVSGLMQAIEILLEMTSKDDEDEKNEE